MFFRRERPTKLTFEDHVKQLREAGFQTVPQPGGHVQVVRNGMAAIIADGVERPKMIGRGGVLMGSEIARLVDGGFQKFFETPSGVRKPALAADLKEVHAFQEDLREALGLPSLYNESLGSVSNLYLYDRVKDRDLGRPPKPWEQRIR
jgi:hypothetical protein